MGKRAVEVYPSEELLVIDKGKGEKVSILYQRKDEAATHLHKAGNALRAHGYLVS